MTLITDYVTLQSAIADELNRGDLTAAIPAFVQLLEADLELSEAARFERSGESLTLNASPLSLPSDMDEPISLRYDDGIRFGDIDIVPEEALPRYRAQFGLTGFPRAAAITANGTQLLLAPVPDQAYVALFSYRAKLERLSDGTATSNWILQRYPNIYLYGSLIHSAPYLKHDERVAVWKSLYDEAISKLDAKITRRQVANTLVQRPRRAIG